jgi:NADPH2:quinone reductase
MKAVLCKEFGLPETLVIENIPTPKVEKGQVLISVKACGVNFPDTLMIQGKYQIKPPLPFSPGGEIAGIIEEIGEGVTEFAIGDKVFALTGFGGFAEKAVVDVNRALLMPERMDFITASSVMYTYGTSYHALKNRANLKAGETLLVMGAAGGVGLAAVELGTIMGAKVIAAASSDEKLALCKQYGASEVINYDKEDLRERIKEISNGKGVDVIYDPVGGNYTEAAFRSIAWKGRYLVVGFASGTIPNLPLNLVLLKGASIVGVFWGAFSTKESKQSMLNFQELLELIEKGNLKPHIHAQYQFEQVAEALNEILHRKVRGKIILKP